MAGSKDALRDLPVPISGTHATGNPPPGAAQDAARLLYFARLIANTAGVPVFQLQQPLPDGAGHIGAQVAGPLAYKKIHARPSEEEAPPPEENPPAIVRLVWLPEGFVITPRSAQDPQGRGLPPNADGSYTPGGPLPQVIINQLPHNGYPDALYRQEMQKVGIAQIPAATRVCAANLFFKDWELLDEGFGIGLHLPDPKDSKKTIWRAQFKNRFETNFAEARDASGAWYCHRPQFAKENSVRQYLRQQTNSIRNMVGKKPLGAPLRGMEGELSESPAYMTQYSGVFGHDSYQFRDGHWSFDMRFERAAPGSLLGGENLHVQPGSHADVTTTNIAVQGWRTSPGHHANMIHDWHAGDDKKHYASLDSAVRPLLPDAAVHTSQNGPPYFPGSGETPVNPPIKPAIVSSQIFDGKKDWVFHNGLPRRGDDELLPLVEYRLLRHSYFHFSAYYFLNSEEQRHKDYEAAHPPPAPEANWLPRLAWRGRMLSLGKVLRDVNRFEIMGIKEVMRNGEIAALRAVCREQSADDESVHIVLYEGAITDFADTCAEIGRLDISGNDSHLFSQPVFSASGEKMALMHARLSTHTGPFAHEQRYLGQTLYFYEFDSGTFQQIKSVSAQTQGSGYNRTIDMNIEYLPVYGGESLDYVMLRIDTSCSDSGGTVSGDFSCHLDFPSGHQITCYDLQLSSSASFAQTGFFQVIMALDVEHPQSALLARYEIIENEGVISCDMVCAGQTFKSATNPFKSFGQFTMTPFPARVEPVSVVLLNPGNNRRSVGGYVEIGDAIERSVDGSPQTLLLAGIVSQFETVNTSCGKRKNDNPMFKIKKKITHYATYKYVASFVGPLVAEQDYWYFLPHDFQKISEWQDGVLITSRHYFDMERNRNRFFYFRYGDSFIHAGRVDNPLGPVGKARNYFFKYSAGLEVGDFVEKIPAEGVGWQGDDQYYFFSNLDLKEITGMPDLSDNILPVGII